MAVVSAAAGIRFDDRVLLVGDTGSGKSELLNHLHTIPRTQKLLIDTKAEFSVPGVEPARRPEQIDWRQPFIHFVDEAGDLDDYDEVFRQVMQRKRPLSICVHELGDLCGDQPGRTPRWVGATYRKGRSWGIGILGGTQRPVNMPKIARTTAQHVMAFRVPELDVEDRDLVGRMMGLRPLDRFDAELDKLAELAPPEGEYAYLWWDQRARRLRRGPPLPAQLRARIPVRRLTL